MVDAYGVYLSRLFILFNLAAKVKTSRCNENSPIRLGTSGRGANGQPIIRVRSRAVNGAGELEEEQGGDRPIHLHIESLWQFG